MMWDLSGGRRSPHPSATGPPPPFPTPQHFAPPSSPAPPGRPRSNAATYASSHAPTLSFGYPVGQVPSTSRSDSFGQTYDRQHHQAYEQYQTARGLPFPAANSYGQISPSQMQYTSQQTIVVHRSKHHSKSKHSSGNRLRRHSHSGGMPVANPSVPQVPIYSSGHGSGSRTHLKPALVHHSTSSHNLSSSYQGHRPSYSQPHVAFQVPSSSTSKPKPKPSKSPSHTQQPCVHYSKCTGRRKALCIGINYTGQRNELRGCVNDAKRMRKFLISHGYPPEDVILLTDDAKDPRALPTKKNIIGCMKWLVKGAQPNDALFFHYSGHGGQTPDLDGDELDGYDEVIFPLDFKKSGHITDDEMHDIMVRPLPDDCRLTALFDACHSGTVLDLPYIYSSHGRLKGSHITDRARRSKATNADVISWSGCKDGQTSADTFQGGVAVGAMSHAFTTALTSNPNQTYQELLRSIRLILHPRYSQKPQLGSSHHIDTTLKFVF